MTSWNIQLRPYQQRAVAEIRAGYRQGFRRILFVLPTGGGKTIVFVFVAASAMERGKRVLILGHRQEICDQISAALTAMGIEHGIVAPGHRATDHAVQIGSVASVVRRLDGMQPFDLIVVDESHHAASPSWRKILSSVPNARVLGVTATPERYDRRGLEDLFDLMICGPSQRELVAMGYLVPPRVFAPKLTPDLSNVAVRAGEYAADQLSTVMANDRAVNCAVDDYLRRASGIPAVAFCCNIAHSRLLVDRLIKAGIKAAHVDGETPKDERRHWIKALGTGEVQVLTNVALISEGVDIPAIGAAILLRPTKSLSLHLQQAGRALRAAPGKASAIILDHAGNSFRHGLPDADRAWSLEGFKPSKEDHRLGSLPRLQRCYNCGALNHPAPTCANCGANRRQVEIDVELKEVRHDVLIRELQLAPHGDAVKWAGNSVDRLRLVVGAKGYKPGWIYHRLREAAA